MYYHVISINQTSKKAKNCLGLNAELFRFWMFQPTVGTSALGIRQLSCHRRFQLKPRDDPGAASTHGQDHRQQRGPNPRPFQET